MIFSRWAVNTKVTRWSDNRTVISENVLRIDIQRQAIDYRFLIHKKIFLKI
jgi:hypothetical protein